MSGGPRITRWWWIRHAPVTGHGGRIYGQDDLPADCSDASLFELLAGHLPGDAVWVASHLRRTHETAAAIGAALRGVATQGADWSAPELVVEPALAEQHFGEWQGLTNEELRLRRNGELPRFWLAPAHEAPPGGESFVQVIDRVGAAVERLTRAHAGRDIVAVAHGGSIRAALAHALGLEPERALAFVIDNCSLTRLDHVESGEGGAGRRGSWRVTAVNLHPHAPGLR
jgi:alpha-ribazole phosphatase